jgi:two-component system, cell cycle sensor histidine kinase and response regulator CckA
MPQPLSSLPAPELSRIMADSSRDPIVLVAEDHRIIEANQAAIHQYQYSHDELFTLTIDRLRAPGATADIDERIAEVESAGGALFETVHARKDGTTFPVEISARAATVQGERVFVSVIRDISERLRADDDLRRTEEARRVSEERAQQLVEQAPIPIACHRDGQTVFANEAHRRLYGYTDLSQISVADLVAPQDRDRVLDRLRRRTLGLPVEPEYEFVGQRADGSTFPAFVKATPVRLSDGPAILVFHMDLSEQRRLEAQFRQAQKMDAVGQLAGGVAHDFNNILAASLMQIGLLQMMPAPAPGFSAALTELEEQTRRAAALTRQLLMFSRRSVLSIKPVDLDHVIANLLRMLARLIGEHIELDYLTGDDVPAVNADAGMIEQVVMNLVVNARDAMPRGGRISIRTEPVVLGLQEVDRRDGKRAGRFACVSVADTGCGMDADTQARLFEPFFTTKETGKGTGLGLATAHGIVAQHGGWIEFDSAVDAGSTFRVYLPALDGPAAAAVPADHPHVGLGRGEGILVVEDDAALRKALLSILTAEGYAVFEAASGHDALRLWTSIGGNIDLVLTDFVMPEGMTGLDLLQHVRRENPGVRAIITSGYGAAMAESASASDAITSYLPKPFDREQVARAVRERLDAGGLA